MAEGDLPRVAYRGFLSYSHRDAAAAAKLHRALETYRLPKQLVATGVQERLTPIFRDREELSAGADLSAQVREALAGSESLIILCSPHAKASIWVNKEIETFRAIHPDRPILAAILEGEPGECFPAALTQLPSPFRGEGARRAGEGPIPDERSRSPESASSADPSPQPSPLEGEGATLEPIAADLRKSGDGWRLGQLKLIAGMAGVPLDALVQRDHARQLRRVTAITVASLLTVLIMSALLVFAVRAQRDAERQRAEAEGLVEYMLTDLRDRLKGVGRLDVMTAVNERAMGYYGAQGDPANLADDSLERRARVISALAENMHRGGNSILARRGHVELNRTTAALLEKDSDNPKRMLDHALSENRLALFDGENGHIGRAIARLTNAARLLRRAEGSLRTSEEWVRLTSLVEGNLCVALFKQEKSAQKALPFCVRAVKIGNDLVATSDNKGTAIHGLTFQYAWLSDVYDTLGRSAEAKSARARAERLTGYLVQSDRRNMAWRQQQLEIAMKFARANALSGRLDEAAALLAKIKPIREVLVKHDPRNRHWVGLSDKFDQLEKEVNDDIRTRR